MRLGVFISGSLHILLILYAIVTLPRAFEDAGVPMIIPVELYEIADETNIMARREDPVEETEEPPAQEEEPEPPKQEVKEPEPEPEPEPEIEEDVELIPEEDPEPEDEPDPEPEEEQVAEAPPPPPLPAYVPVIKPPPPPEKFDLDNIAALLDKMPEEEEPRQDPLGIPNQQQVLDENLPDRAFGAGTGLTLSQEDAFRQQMAKCWSPPTGAALAEDLVVAFEIRMNPDGTLAGMPRVREDMSSTTHPYYLVSAESALRALQICQPYQLPPDRYRGVNGWNTLLMTFSPRSMLGR